MTAVLDLEETVDDWLDTLFLSHAPKSVDTYRLALEALIKFLKQEGVHSWSDCQRVHLSRYFSQAQDEKALKLKSLKLKLSAFRLFFKYLLDTAKLDSDPSVHIRLKQPAQHLPKLIDVDVMFRLLDQPSPKGEKDAQLWLRDKAMFELLYGSGLRVAELVSLDIADVDRQARLVSVLGKGGRQRQVPVGKKSLQALLDYLPVRALWHKNDSALFISHLGKRLSTRSVQLRLEAAAKRAGIDQSLHPHLLRHAFASHLLSGSGDLRAVQELLGHRDLAATQIYTHLDFAALSSVYDKTHPRASQKNHEH